MSARWRKVALIVLALLLFIPLIWFGGELAYRLGEWLGSN